MSWDVMVFNYGGNPKPLSQMNDSDRPKVMGTPAEVRNKINAYLPGVDWKDPTWGMYRGDSFSFEFSMREEAQKEGFMVHVHGGGDVIRALLRFSVPNQWSLLDCSTSEWLDPENPSSDGWQGFQAFRDKVLGQSGNDDET